MSVLIKDMAMPISCERCPMLDWDLDYIKCKVTDRHFKMTECWRYIRVPDCPLVPVPPHGRLVDADRILSEQMKRKYYHLPNGDTAIPVIDVEHAPTVIPAEPAEEVET